VTCEEKNPRCKPGARGTREPEAEHRLKLVLLGYNFQMAQVATKVRVRILFFGQLRELVGVAEESGELPAGATLAQVFERYAERFPKLAGFRNSMVVSRNQEFAAWDTPVSAGDEIAFLPPVSGG